jgi:hypothetical protein
LFLLGFKREAVLLLAGHALCFLLLAPPTISRCGLRHAPLFGNAIFLFLRYSSFFLPLQGYAPILYALAALVFFFAITTALLVRFGLCFVISLPLRQRVAVGGLLFLDGLILARDVSSGLAPALGLPQHFRGLRFLFLDFSTSPRRSPIYAYLFIAVFLLLASTLIVFALAVIASSLLFFLALFPLFFLALSPLFFLASSCLFARQRKLLGRPARTHSRNILLFC